ncbi:MAG: transcription initiation factor TFIIIB subunit Brf1 [Amphiamblys sp. WSBS2006]|nr:MAG: transcription initiation factor TFIIIB subunit Brf1 [Amphiamblys sp. WSBS2006]
MECPHCTSTSLQTDPAQGHTVCTDCGSVLEENTVVTEVQFTDKSGGGAAVQGQFVSATTGHAAVSKMFGKKIYLTESRETTIYNARNKISAIGTAVGISQKNIDLAVRWFSLALQHGFTRGRPSELVVASCLYIECRRDRTAHMLVDFANILCVSVFSIGSVFLKLVILLKVQVPLIDPAFYLQRFAARLEFGERSKEVVDLASDITGRMQRDWLHVGRRPAGVCCAALIIAAKLSGFRRTEHDLAEIVSIAPDTIRRRIAEFCNTPAGKMTPAGFRESRGELGEEDPPAYKKGLLAIEQKKESRCQPAPLRLKAETLSDTETDDETSAAILSKEEAELKTELWMDEHEEYIAEQETKKKIKQEEKTPKKRKRKGTQAEEEKEKKVSKKINYKVLENLFQKETSV